MPFGDGRYGPDAARLRRRLHAKALILLVIDGVRGHGVAVTAQPSAHAALHKELPGALRALADSLELEGLTQTN